MKFFILPVLVVLVSCSFKKPNDDGKGISTREAITAVDFDSDGDGISDSEELKNGSDPFVADVPEFVGEMMEEIKINAHYYSRSQDKFESGEMLVKSDDDQIVFKKGSSLVRYISEDTSAFAERSVNNLSAQFSSKDINTYTAPIISDEVAHNFMSQISEMETRGFSLDEVEFEVRNRIRLNSSYLKNFRDIVFEAYFYDYQLKKLEFIDYYENKGSFEFNKDHLLDIPSIKTRNIRILSNSVLKTGRFLYIKLKDFYIPELRKNYSDLMKEVQKKSIPLIINEPNRFEVKYVGMNGGANSFVNIVEKGLKNNFEIDNNTFIKYKSYPVGEYRHDTANGDRINVFSKWHVITNEIPNNPFSYSFLSNDIIVLNYSKSTDPVFLARDVVNTFTDTARMKTLKGEPIYPAKTRKLKIILSGIVKNNPSLAVSYVSRPTCGTLPGWGPNSNQGAVTYKVSTMVMNQVAINSLSSDLEVLLNNTFLDIDGFEYPLLKLVEEKKFVISIGDAGQIVLESTESFIKGLKNFGINLVNYSVLHRRQQKSLLTGEEVAGCDCRTARTQTQVGCQYITQGGAQSTSTNYEDYTFYTSVFVF